MCAGGGRGQKDAALLKMADAIEAHEAEILAANEKDLQAARESGMRKSMLDRLALTSARIAGMARECARWRRRRTRSGGGERVCPSERPADPAACACRSA